MNYEFVDVTKMQGVQKLDDYGTLGFVAKDTSPSVNEGEMILLTKKNERCIAEINGFTLVTGTYGFVFGYIKNRWPSVEIVDCYTNLPQTN